MVVGTVDSAQSLADVVFVIEGTASNGAYISDIKKNYIIPTLEYFNQGSIDDRDYIPESISTLYALVVFYASDCSPYLNTDCHGPFSTPHKFISILESLEMVGGRGESHSHVAEGLATAMQCFEDFQLKREPGATPQKHCILISNSPPYNVPTVDSLNFFGQNAEQLASQIQENGINLSIISPRKIPALFKLFEKGGGDLSASQTKNYAKDLRHLVLLKGFSLKERPVSPAPTPAQPNVMPIANIGSPAPPPPPQQATPQQVFRPNVPPARPPMGFPQNQGQAPFRMEQPQLRPGMGPRWQQPPTPNMMQAQQMRAGMQPQQAQQQQQQPNQASTLIAQLQQPPAGVMPQPGMNQQFQQGPRMDGGAVMNPMQQQQQHMMQNMRMPTNPGGVGPQQQTGQMAPQQPAPGPQQPAQMQGVPPAVQGPAAAAMPPGAVPPQMQAQQQPGQMQPGMSQQQQQAAGRERQTIWTGVLEWIEKARSTDAQKMTRHVPCQVSANIKDGEPELRADGWPPKLLMQLMPKQLIGSIGGTYLKNSKSVLFHPQQCEALESLTRVMSSGFAGCVHFTSQPSPNACDIKVLILLYTAEKRAYLGFIPNDQTAFVDRLRKVIQHQKSTQAIRQGQGPAPGAPNPVGPGGMGSPAGMGQMQPPVQQQGMMMTSQTNPMVMGGVQLTQNNVPGQMQPQMPMGQQRPQMAMQPGFEQGGDMAATQQVAMIRPQGMMTPQQQPQQQTPIVPEAAQQQPGQVPIRGMLGPGPQQQQIRPQLQQQAQQPTNQQLEEARQQNLRKIQQLRHTLEQAQQQEQQYSRQMMEEEQQKQLRAQLQQMQQRQMNMTQGQPMQPQVMAPQQQQQQRMMRPAGQTMNSNPGLRHLLQQQPQYRQQQQAMGMNQMGVPRQMNPQQQPQQGNQQYAADDSTYDFLG